MDNPIIYGGIFLFLAVWMIVLNLISRLTGWAKLAAHYRSEGEFRGKTWKFQSVAMRLGGGYNNCVKVGADPRGLHLSLFPLFKPGHPPLFIRWPEIAVKRKKKWGINRVELRFQRTENIPVIISMRLAQRLADAAGSEWQGPQQSRLALSDQVNPS